ncbi:MAG: glycosyltransferase family 2 protein [Elainellaceae cyanobacterium]
MKVSVITVCRNAESTIAKTIEGVLSQTYPQIEHLIIDGASTDRTLEIIERHRQKASDRLTTVISEPDDGIYQAMNKGIRHATGDWLYFANADDYLFDENVIQDLVEFVQQHPDSDLIYGDHEARFTNGGSNIYQPVAGDRLLEEMICLGDDRIHQPASFFRASLFTDKGLYFNESYRIAADYEWFLKVLQASQFTVYYYPRTVVSYAHGGASGDFESLFHEVFEIQRQDALCSSPEWLSKRLERMQELYVFKSTRLERSHSLAIARLRQIKELTPIATRVPGLEEQIRLLTSDYESQISTLNTRIAAMESSKFWQLRSQWFTLKRKLGLPTDDG